MEHPEPPRAPDDQRLRQATLVTVGRYEDDPSWGAVRSAAGGERLTWLDVVGPTLEELHDVADAFGLRHEVTSDSLEFGQRTRLSDDGGSLLIVMYGVDDDDELMELHLYVSGHDVVTIRNRDCPPIEELGQHASRAISEHTTVAQLMSRILSLLAGTYADALERVDEELSAIEERIVDGVAASDLEELMVIRKRVNRFRRVVDPARDLVGAGRYAVIDALEDVSDDTRRHLRDLAVDLAYVGDHLEAERDRISSAMDVYMNRVNIRQNDIMKKLAAVSTVFLPLTFLTGFFGMNFGWMIREAITGRTRFLVLGVGLNVLVACLALAVLYRRGWLVGEGDTVAGRTRRSARHSHSPVSRPGDRGSSRTGGAEEGRDSAGQGAGESQVGAI